MMNVLRRSASSSLFLRSSSSSLFLRSSIPTSATPAPMIIPTTTPAAIPMRIPSSYSLFRFYKCPRYPICTMKFTKKETLKLHVDGEHCIPMAERKNPKNKRPPTTSTSSPKKNDESAAFFEEEEAQYQDSDDDVSSQKDDDQSAASLEEEEAKDQYRKKFVQSAADDFSILDMLNIKDILRAVLDATPILFSAQKTRGCVGGFVPHQCNISHMLPYFARALASSSTSQSSTPRQIEFYGDFDGSFHSMLELEKDPSGALLGHRSQRL